MRPLFLLLFCAVLLPTSILFGQTEISIRNNTRHDLNISATQHGTYTMAANDWELTENFIEWWAEDQEVFTTERLSPAVPNGDTVFFDIKVTSLTDSILIKLRLVGTANGSTLAYGVGGQGIAAAWHADTNFHQVSAVMGGRNVIVKFKPDNSDASQSMDILFAIHDAPIYEIDPADATNPHIINVMSFNAQMLPGGIAGLKEAELRADLIPLEISPYQDVVVFQELMDKPARIDHLIPGMVAAGFPYYTLVLNDSDIYVTNGGVIFFSRWPIERTSDWEYSACGPASEDCLAIKGVQYIQINKLGIRYHLFGTHMDAGSQQPDLHARQVQMGEIRQFVEAQNIPAHDAVMLAGDFNISPFTTANQYNNMLDSINPVLPNFTGFYSSTDNNSYPGKIIDHVWPLKDYLVPLEATNYVTTFRSIDDRMWEMSWLGDHRPVLGRFVFPDITLTRKARTICPGDSLNLAVSTTLTTSYTWQKDGTSIADTTNSISYHPADANTEGTYTCAITYSATFGGTGDSLNRFFHLNGEETINKNLVISFGEIVVDSVLCLLGVNDMPALEVRVYPNPAHETLVLEVPNANGEVLVVTLTDLQGRTMIREIMENGTLSLPINHLPTGMYLVYITGPQGTATGKVLVGN